MVFEKKTNKQTNKQTKKIKQKLLNTLGILAPSSEYLWGDFR